ncbi:MAG TPA: hypothetical protein VH253_03780 [Phycisphaerae bacterium]|nr:hypothetical protein [Phycisphaerae bacterium]
MEHLPVDALFREKVLRARAAPAERKLLAPARLFEYARGIAMAGIRRQHPEATELEVRELFRQRMKLGRELERGL